MTDEEISEWIESSELTHTEIIEDKYIIGRYRVMFGYRIRGGKIGDMVFGFDICCGRSEELLNCVHEKYSKLMRSEELLNCVHEKYSKLMRKNLKSGKSYYEGLRSYSEVKPIHNDLEYMKWLSEL
jgi:hypothetical protein